MKYALLFVLFALAISLDAQPPAPVKKITPGKVIVPTDRMRRIWGELIRVDPKTRTGTFRNEGNDDVMPFTIMPYAELLHHATFGDLQDYRVGERAIFRLHENDAGEWTLLTYIQDEMNFLNGHKEYFHVDAIDAGKGRLEVTLASGDKSFIRTKGLFLDTDKETRYWKNAQPAKFADIKVGDKLRTQTHGVGKGQMRVCWEVFLDDESLIAFQTKQKAVHQSRLAELGLPGYVDSNEKGTVEMTLFQEFREIMPPLKTGVKVRVAAAGVDRKATGQGTLGKITAFKMAGNLGKVTVQLEESTRDLPVTQLARMWIETK